MVFMHVTNPPRRSWVTNYNTFGLPHGGGGRLHVTNNRSTHHSLVLETTLHTYFQESSPRPRLPQRPVKVGGEAPVVVPTAPADARHAPCADTRRVVVELAVLRAARVAVHVRTDIVELVVVEDGLARASAWRTCARRQRARGSRRNGLSACGVRRARQRLFERVALSEVVNTGVLRPLERSR